MANCNSKFRRWQKTLLVLLALMIPGGALLAAPRPVLLELFTSNSCSSCPPATALLSRLLAKPPVKDVQLIVLSQHVDYWNNLGWVDRYSDAQFSERQRDYARKVFGASHVFTPQLVVNGRRDMVGSRAGEASAAINAQVGEASLPVSVNVRQPGRKAADVSVSVAAGSLPETATVWLALTQDHVVSHIGGGENNGRRLEEDGVVRLLEPLGTYRQRTQAEQRYQTTLSLPDDADNLAVVAFVQQSRSRAIVGAAKTTLAPVSQSVSQR